MPTMCYTCTFSMVQFPSKHPQQTGRAQRLPQSKPSISVKPCLSNLLYMLQDLHKRECLQFKAHFEGGYSYLKSLPYLLRAINSQQKTVAAVKHCVEALILEETFYNPNPPGLSLLRMALMTLNAWTNTSLLSKVRIQMHKRE